MSTTIKIFIVKIVLYIIAAIAMLGFIFPYLISSQQDELVIGGIILLIAFVIGMTFRITSTIKNFINDKRSIECKRVS